MLVLNWWPGHTLVVGLHLVDHKFLVRLVCQSSFIIFITRIQLLYWWVLVVSTIKLMLVLIKHHFETSWNKMPSFQFKDLHYIVQGEREESNRMEKMGKKTRIMRKMKGEGRDKCWESQRKRKEGKNSLTGSAPLRLAAHHCPPWKVCPPLKWYWNSSWLQYVRAREEWSEALVLFCLPNHLLNQTMGKNK